MTTTVRAATHEFMRRCGMTPVFGNPGSTEIKFFRDWPPDFRYVLWYTAIQKPCGPVFVSIPEDDGDALCEPVPERQVSAGIAPHPLALRALAEALSTARSPVLVMGAAVDQDDAWDAPSASPMRLEAPVWSSPMSARASFPETRRLFAGFLPPVRAQVVKKLAAHDVIVVLGAPVFTYHIYTHGDFLPPSASLWLLTDDPDAAHARSPGRRSAAHCDSVSGNSLQCCRPRPVSQGGDVPGCGRLPSAICRPAYR